MFTSFVFFVNQYLFRDRYRCHSFSSFNHLVLLIYTFISFIGTWFLKELKPDLPIFWRGNADEDG
jgi:hypothetical protein